MKIFQILDGFCHWDATKTFPTIEATVGNVSPSIQFVEAPDHVFEGWGYIDGEFVQPTPPEGWLYDAETGTFYPSEAILPAKTPAQLREAVYNTDPVIEWEGESLTVTQAAQKWQYYASEGNDKATTLQTLIAEAKAAIRAKYPDGEG